MEKFITKENIVIIGLVIWVLIQSNIFATKLDLAELRNEVLQQKIELQKYSDTKDNELLNKIEQKYETILIKLDKINGKN